MEKRLVLELVNHHVYYVTDNYCNYYIAVPKCAINTNIAIELKSKMANYNIEANDPVLVMENVKSTFSFVDAYNITLVLPILNSEGNSILEKLVSDNFDKIEMILCNVINSAYMVLKNENMEIANQVIMIDNDRYSSFIGWFTNKYKDRIILKKLLDLIQLFNVNATSYKKFETPVISFVVGSYEDEVNVPEVIHEEVIPPTSNEELKPQFSSGFSNYWLLAIITLIVSLIVAIICFIK